MAHIISCVADADEPFTFEPYIAKAASPEPRNESVSSLSGPLARNTLASATPNVLLHPRLYLLFSSRLLDNTPSWYLP